MGLRGRVGGGDRRFEVAGFKSRIGGRIARRLPDGPSDGSVTPGLAISQ